MKVLLDANFLMIPGQFKVDIFTELTKFGKPELYTIDLVVNELKELAKIKGKNSRPAKLALELIGKWNIGIIETGGERADQEIERIAAEGEYAVCTQDKILAKRLLREEVKVIFLRSRKILEYYTL